MKLNFRRFVAILLVAMMTLTALPTAGIAEVMQDVSRESGSIRTMRRIIHTSFTKKTARPLSPARS